MNQKTRMKEHQATKVSLQLVLSLALMALVGCASQGYQKGSDTAARLSATGDQIAAGKGKIDAALAALNGLVNNPQGDLVPKYVQFTTALSDLQTTANHMNTGMTNLSRGANAYFKTWDEKLAQIKNDELRKSSSDRKATVQKQFADLQTSYAQYETALKPFLADLKDIQTALGADLTLGGISAVKVAADRVNQKADPLKVSVDQLTKACKDLGSTMATSGPPPAPAATGS